MTFSRHDLISGPKLLRPTCFQNPVCTRFVDADALPFDLYQSEDCGLGSMAICWHSHWSRCLQWWAQAQGTQQQRHLSFTEVSFSRWEAIRVLPGNYHLNHEYYMYLYTCHHMSTITLRNKKTPKRHKTSWHQSAFLGPTKTIFPSLSNSGVLSLSRLPKVAFQALRLLRHLSCAFNKGLGWTWK